MILKIEYVLFYTLDCLTRSVEERAKILRLFEERGILFEDIKPVEFSVKNGKFCGYGTTIANFITKRRIKNMSESVRQEVLSLTNKTSQELKKILKPENT